MFVYVIKCVNYFKIGHSKNPSNRRATIQTHNPLDVRICALFKSDRALDIEKALHLEFIHRKSRGEWFELKHNDLKRLKTEFGFTFKIPLAKIFDDGDFDNSEKKLATQSVRKVNLQVDDLIEYFEEIFQCEIIDPSNIRKAVMKYNHESVKQTIDDLYGKNFTAQTVLNGMVKYSKYTHLKINDPESYFIFRLKGMFWGRYKYGIDKEDIDNFKQTYFRILKNGDIEESLSIIQAKSYHKESDEMLEYVYNYLIN